MMKVSKNLNGTYSSEIIWEDTKDSYLAMNMLARKSGIIFATTGDWSGIDSTTEGAMYHMTAKDSYDGRVIWKIRLGIGKTFAHDYGGIYFNANNAIYVGTENYIICIRNAKQ